jgi:La-related protein 7
MSSSGSNQPQVGDEKKVQLLSRSLSGSKLNAKAPEFVPKGLAAFSTSLPGPIVQGLGFSPPTLVAVPSSVIPVIVQPPVVNVVLSPAVEEILVESPPSADGVHPNETTEGLDLVLGQDLAGESEHSHAPSATAVTQVVKPVVTEELKAKIVKQVEFYFSDTNLPTDNYLMKFVKKDPEGFVPIPVVASFRKIKNLVKNHGVVAAALRNSSQLVVSDDGKKVRRVHPLPDVDLEEVQARTVVAENLPEDHSIETMEQLFGKVGTVKMVRICHPEAANGANQTAAKHPKTDMIVSNKLHALVEYETVELAEKAVAELTDERNWRSGLRVRLLLRRQFQSKHSYQQAPHQRGRKPSSDGTELGFEEEESVSEKVGERTEKNGEDMTGMHHHVDRSDDVVGCEAGDGGNKKGRGRGRGGRTGGRGRGQQYHTHSGTPPQSSLHLASEIVGKPPPGPRMPDGTRGFSTGRGKPLAVNNAVNTLA